ncbi:MAG: fibrobacter succinogenes major paralogous domain-containing protein, partial [Prevotella sp.]|nr:fibrobacter succinogenes major paralogous domain-containing protein [Prevotella sp.]
DNKGDSDNELRFYTESDSKATGALTASLGGMTLGAGYASHVITPVPDGDPVVSTYSIGKVRQYYKIILPKTTYPISGTLTIKDEKTQLEEELDITSVPVYENTDFKPVLVGGAYWAPVNVGATKITYSADLDGCGYYFQWGRSYARFIYNSAIDLQGGPVTAAEASGIYANMFITTSGNDWLQLGEDDDRWQGDNAQGPCPDGWRVPADTELAVLQGKYLQANISNSCLRIPRDTGQSGGDLYLPLAGSCASTGVWSSANGYYWSSTILEAGARRLAIGGAAPNLNASSRGYGYSVRCIQK